jgi:hypothetical protein
MRAYDRDHHRLSGREALLDERCQEGGELLRVAPEKRLVAIALLRARWCSLWHDRVPPVTASTPAVNDDVRRMST